MVYMNHCHILDAINWIYQIHCGETENQRPSLKFFIMTKGQLNGPKYEGSILIDDVLMNEILKFIKNVNRYIFKVKEI